MARQKRCRSSGKLWPHRACRDRPWASCRRFCTLSGRRLLGSRSCCSCRRSSTCCLKTVNRLSHRIASTSQHPIRNGNQVKHPSEAQYTACVGVVKSLDIPQRQAWYLVQNGIEVAVPSTAMASHHIWMLRVLVYTGWNPTDTSVSSQWLSTIAM